MLTESLIVKDDTAKVERRCENKVSDDRKNQRDNCGESRRLNMVISATFDFERALGGPQVQFSQARRHLSEECNSSLPRGTGTTKNKLRDGEKGRADETIIDDYLMGAR